jgi:hypothetical protein
MPHNPDKVVIPSSRLGDQRMPQVPPVLQEDAETLLVNVPPPESLEAKVDIFFFT